MDPTVKLKSSEKDHLQNPIAYRRLFGKLLYLTISRSGITFVVHKLSQFMAKPNKTHMDAANHLLRYIKGSLGQEIFLSKSPYLSVKAFTYADWGSCSNTRRSVTGFCVFLEKSLVSWKSKKQQTVSRSSTDVEYRTSATVSCEVIWLKSLLKELQIEVDTPNMVYYDNQVAVYITNNPMFHERTKHKNLIVTSSEIGSLMDSSSYFLFALLINLLMHLLNFSMPQHCLFTCARWESKI